MLRYFFDCESDYKHLFEGLTVAQDEEVMARHQGKYPVIYLSFKDTKAGDYPSAVLNIAQLLYEEWLRHDCLKGTKDYDERLADMHASLRSGKITTSAPTARAAWAATTSASSPRTRQRKASS